MKKILSLVIAIAMLCTLSITAFARDDQGEDCNCQDDCNSKNCKVAGGGPITGNQVESEEPEEPGDEEEPEEPGEALKNGWYVVTVEVTCENAGYTGWEYYEDGVLIWAGDNVYIDALGHLCNDTIWDGWGWLGTCEREGCGWQGYFKHECNWVEVTVDPTCSLEGYTTMVCDNDCGAVWGYWWDYTDALGHDFQSCVFDGWGWLYSDCSRCDWQGYGEAPEVTPPTPPTPEELRGIITDAIIAAILEAEANDILGLIVSTQGMTTITLTIDGEDYVFVGGGGLTSTKSLTIEGTNFSINIQAKGNSAVVTWEVK